MRDRICAHLFIQGRSEIAALSPRKRDLGNHKVGTKRYCNAISCEYAKGTDMKTAYLDCFAGISGDMFVGALLDAGMSLEALRRALQSLPLDGYAIETEIEQRNHLHGTRFLVKVDRDSQVPRGLHEIEDMVHRVGLSDAVKARVMDVFRAIAEEEGRIHQEPPEKVHFHEVGAVDSIIDIVSTVFGLEFLGISSLYASPLPLGSGFVETQHGRIPLPAPATVALLKGFPVVDSGLAFELVTPTGAALVQVLATANGSMPPMIIESVGYGVGSMMLPDRPNLLRLLVGRSPSEEETETVVMLEANIDDANPEWLGYLMDLLFERGALDVVFLPAHMKKNRLGTILQVVGKPEQKDELMQVLFRESTTLGIRFHYVQRKILQRTPVEIQSPWGKILAKQVIRPDGEVTLSPEYEVCRNIAKKNHLPIREVYSWVLWEGKNRGK